MLVVVMDVMPDRVQEVGLTEASRPVDKERVVRTSWRFSNTQSGSERKLVRGTFHECLECVPRVQPGIVGPVHHRGRIGARIVVDQVIYVLIRMAARSAA